MKAAMKRLMLMARWRMTQREQRAIWSTALPIIAEPFKVNPVQLAAGSMMFTPRLTGLDIDLEFEIDSSTPQTQAVVAHYIAELQEFFRSRGVDHSSDIQQMIDRAIDRALERYIASYRAVPGPRRKQ